jgi:hypothetical protein
VGVHSAPTPDSHRSGILPHTLTSRQYARCWSFHANLTCYSRPNRHCSIALAGASTAGSSPQAACTAAAHNPDSFQLVVI